MSDVWGPLDQALQRLREHGLPYRWHETDLKVWLAACPSCRAGGWDLRIREAYRGGPVVFHCRTCSDAEVRKALALEPVHPRIEKLEAHLAGALDLAEQARDIAVRAAHMTVLNAGAERKVAA
jgi:hypothetical protein